MTKHASRIASLASLIQTNTNKIDEYLKKNGQPSPSFDVSADTDFILPKDIAELQQQVLVACTDLQALLEGPRGHMTHITSPRVNVLMSLQFIYHFKIATRFPITEEISFEELAQRCSVDKNQLKRMMRMAVSNHIFTEPRKGVLAHSAISKLLAEDPIAHEWVGLAVEEMTPTATTTVPALIKWPGSQEPTETGFRITHGDSLWNILQKEPERAQRFASSMQYLQSHPAFAFEFLTKSLAWDDNNAPKTLVDIGGSRGYISMWLLKKYPGLKCYVQDSPETLEGVVAPQGLKDRLQFMKHNFFAEQPVKGADVYFLRSILHDWSDKYSLQIIRNLIPALKDGAKVIVNEIVLPEPNTVPAYHDQLLRGYDLGMLQTFNSPERDAEEWEALFKEADGRFKLNRIVSPPGSFLSVIEFEWQA